MGYYALFSCNEWKEHSSSGLIGVFTREGLNEQLKKEIRENSMEIYLDENESIDILSIQALNIALQYGYIEEITIDEAI